MDWSKRHCIKISQYFLKPHEPFRGEINVKDDLSNYARNSDSKKATGGDTSKLAEKSDLASIKTEIDKLDVDELNTVPVGLSKLSNVVNHNVVQKTVYDKLVTELKNIDISGFILKTKYVTDKSNVEKKSVMQAKNT